MNRNRKRFSRPTEFPSFLPHRHERTRSGGQSRAVYWPVVLKIYSHTITHKTDVGGVKLNLSGEAAVRAAYREIQDAVRTRGRSADFLGVVVQPMISRAGYELILGSSIDPQFGPVLLFGAGGQLVEVFRDRALGLPPLNRTLARRMMERTRIHRALQGVRGRAPVDLGALEELARPIQSACRRATAH